MHKKKDRNSFHQNVPQKKILKNAHIGLLSLSAFYVIIIKLKDDIQEECGVFGQLKISKRDQSPRNIKKFIIHVNWQTPIYKWSVWRNWG